MPASVWRNVVALLVVFSTLVAAIDENYDIEVKVVKPKKSLKKIISSYSTVTNVTKYECNGFLVMWSHVV